MALHMTALVFRCYLFTVVFCLFICFDSALGVPLSREMLLYIRESTLGIFSGPNHGVIGHSSKGITGERPHGEAPEEGALVRLRKRGLCTPLPGIFLPYVRSLCNKLVNDNY